MKNFIYLVQGESELIKNNFHLTGRNNADAIFLTYDKEIDNAIYFPNSTWSEGRNKLLEAAKEKGDYKYYILCDDDIEFAKGNWDEFERLLLLHKPAIGCPLFPKTKGTNISFLNIQVFLINDEQMMAFHRDVIKDGIIVPYHEDLDKIMYWCSSYIQETLIQNLYRSDSLQFNTIEILNNKHDRYDKSNKLIFRKISDEWLTGEFLNNYKKRIDPKKHKIRIRIKILFYTIRFILYRKLKPPSFRIKKNNLLKILKHDSKLLKQYNNLNEE